VQQCAAACHIEIITAACLVLLRKDTSCQELLPPTASIVVTWHTLSLIFISYLLTSYIHHRESQYLIR